MSNEKKTKIVRLASTTILIDLIHSPQIDEMWPRVGET